MKSRILKCINMMTIFTALAMPIRLAAQEQQQQEAKKPQHYTVINLGTLGGTSSYGNAINDQGWVVGAANLPGDQNEHAVLWADGRMIDLGTLGGPNSAPGGINNRGQLAFQSDMSTPDPLGEDFCNFGTYLLCLTFVWENGITSSPLPTLGGNNADPVFFNNRGQLAGFTETAFHDPTCLGPQVLQFLGVIWEQDEGGAWKARALPPFPGDSISAAFDINEKGQVVGGSGTCGHLVALADSLHAVLWQDGTVTDLGTLGGATNNLASFINNRGQVVGSSDLPGDTTGHAFLWEDGVMTDLGVLPGDFSSGGPFINDQGQVVGTSCDASGNCRGFLWQDGVMTDLNTLIPAGSSLYLTSPGGINSRGEITGQAFDQTTGESPAFLAIPTEADPSATQAVANPAPKVILPENVRERLRQRRGFGRFGAGLMRP